MAGEDRWFKLEPRSSASRVQGDCQLVLKLITTQVGSRGAGIVGTSALRPNPWLRHLVRTGSASQRDTGMSQRGRSGFLSYLLLLSRLLQFEHRPDEVEVPWGPWGSWGQHGEGKWWRSRAGGVGVSHHHPHPARPPAELEQLARRAQRACCHRAVPPRSTKQLVCAATGGAVSGQD